MGHSSTKLAVHMAKEHKDREFEMRGNGNIRVFGDANVWCERIQLDRALIRPERKEREEYTV